MSSELEKRDLGPKLSREEQIMARVRLEHARGEVLASLLPEDVIRMHDELTRLRTEHAAQAKELEELRNKVAILDYSVGLNIKERARLRREGKND